MSANELKTLIQQGIVKQVPMEHTNNVVRWGHPDGYFLNAKGKRLTENYPPSQYVHRGGSAYPKFRKNDGHLARHIAMALAFYGERKTYVDKNGKPYVGICHHLVPDIFNYRPANLLCWLTREQHRIADARQRALKTVVPNGNLNYFSYERLRYLQDPRVLTDTEFQTELDTLREELTKHPLVKSTPLDTAAEPHKYYDPFIERD